jgi:hypothetical protein
MKERIDLSKTIPIEAAPVHEVNQERLWAYLEPFSETVRSSGSPEEARAFDHAQTVLEELGYDVRRFEHEAYVSLPGSASLICGGDELECITHAMAASTRGLRLPLRDARTSTDLSGKVALAHGLAGPGAVRELVDRGAAAAVFINTEQRYEMIVSPVWGSPDLDKLEMLPGIPVVSVSREHAERLELAATRSEEVVLETRVRTGWTELPLLEATLPAVDGDGSMVLFSGHVDAWHLGAMDNGAANATMLEVATVLAGCRPRLRRDLRVLFWSGHSHGRYAGSQWYADVNYEELRDSAILHVNIDSVGGGGANVLTEAPCMPESFDLAAGAIGEESGQAYRGVRFERAGDQSFWGHGVSSVWMGLSEQPPADGLASEAFTRLFGASRAGGFGWWWHTPEDTRDKVDPAMLARDCRIYLRLIYEACTEIVPPLVFSRTAADIRGRLEAWSAALEGRLDLGITVTRARELEDALERLEKAWTSKPDSAAWRTQKAVARRLVPLNYVAGPLHEHDPALAQPPMPLLRDLERLVSCEDPDVVRHLRVGLRRRLNYVAERLEEAALAVRVELSRVGGE